MYATFRFLHDFLSNIYIYITSQEDNGEQPVCLDNAYNPVKVRTAMQMGISPKITYFGKTAARP